LAGQFIIAVRVKKSFFPFQLHFSHEADKNKPLAEDKESR
jgi:hypothetical protein